MTNFLSEADFQAFLNSLRQLLESNEKTLAQTNRKLSMPIIGFLELFRLVYGCGLRVSEALYVRKSDIDFEKRILVLNNTKTGYKKCNKCKGQGCEKCNNLGKIRKPQYTTIHPYFLSSLKDYVTSLNGQDLLFNTNRFTVWNYAKQAGKLAGLNVFEQQDERLIEGVWTHLFRKSRAQQMMIDGKSAGEDSDYLWELVKIKLRHSAKGRDVTFRYTNKIGQKLGLNDLLEWEQKHYG